jgi:uncharacterized membrane protein
MFKKKRKRIEYYIKQFLRRNRKRMLKYFTCHFDYAQEKKIASAPEKQSVN